MKKRKEALIKWLLCFFNENEVSNLQPMTNDASFRKYYRISKDKKSFVVMDAPLTTEKPDTFFRVARLMKYYDLSVPECLAYHQEFGFILLTDFGDALFGNQVNNTNFQEYYTRALELMISLISIDASLVPDYEHAKLVSEQQLFVDWFLQYTNVSLNFSEQHMLDQLFLKLADVAMEQPKIFLHRDFHSRNLLIKPDGSLGLIDFQDAVRGPITYDLVSLLKDCYAKWPREKILILVKNYFNQVQQLGFCSNTSENDFIRWFDLMGLQRHLKCLGIFSRLYLRDNRDGYLDDIPRVIEYIREVLALYSELENYKPLFNKCGLV